MPLAFCVDHKHELVSIIASGIVTLPEILQHFAEKEEAGASCYSQLFDAIGVQLDLSVHDLPEIASAARRYTQGRRVPKIAVVTDSFYLQSIATAYAGLTQEEHPEFRIFKSASSARAWLLEESESPTHHRRSRRLVEERGVVEASTAKR